MINLNLIKIFEVDEESDPIILAAHLQVFSIRSGFSSLVNDNLKCHYRLVVTQFTFIDFL
jgi:hypothetical protein